MPNQHLNEALVKAATELANRQLTAEEKAGVLREFERVEGPAELRAVKALKKVSPLDDRAIMEKFAAASDNTDRAMKDLRDAIARAKDR